MITISKEGKEYTYASINEACRENGAKSGKNTVSGVKFLQARGFDCSSIPAAAPSDGSKPASTKAPKKSILEQIVEIAQTVDTKKVDELKAERESILDKLDDESAGATLIDDLRRVKAAIATASHPVATRESVRAVVERLMDEAGFDVPAPIEPEAPEAPETPEAPESPEAPIDPETPETPEAKE